MGLVVYSNSIANSSEVFLRIDRLGEEWKKNMSNAIKKNVNGDTLFAFPLGKLKEK